MKKILALIAMIVSLCACKGTKTLLPSVSGAAGEVLVVIEKEQWEGELGGTLRGFLAQDCNYLAQKEPLYTLTNVTPGGFADLFKVHRNIVVFTIDPQGTNEKINYLEDIWASPQCVIQVCAATPENARELIQDQSARIIATIEQAERNRVIKNTMLYEERSIAQNVNKVFGGSLHCPSGYKLLKQTDDFAWISDEKQYTTQAVLVFKYKSEKTADELEMGKLVQKTKEVLMNNVPGMFENTYMTISSAFPLQCEYLSYKGREFTQIRGMWEVENDYMGGPFVSHSFYSQDGAWVITELAFVYAPRFDKRQYLRQVESLLYSWEWDINY